MGVRRKIVFSAVTVAIVFATLEILLRLAGFQHGNRLEQMRFSFPVDEYNAQSDQPLLRYDRELFWRPIPNTLEHNSRGFNTPEFETDKPEGVYRIVCLGDSCTHFGPNAYPELLQTLLDHQTTEPYEVINAGTIGYTSHQGLTLLRGEVLDWSPDLVTVYFGWNDHWLSRGVSDKDQSARLVAPPSSIERARVLQVFRYLRTQTFAPKDNPLRVAIDDYRNNLQQMVALCRERQVAIGLITAPQALDISVPRYLITSGEVADPRTIVRLHEDYNDVVRQVAAEKDVTLIDLARTIDSLDKRQMFLEDHIHLSESGKIVAAGLLSQRLRSEAEPTQKRPSGQ